MVVQYRRQPPPSRLEVWTDSDFAGCTRTRKSTSSASVLYGAHWLRSSSTTQQVQALSTGEAEFHALVKGCSMALGFEAMLRDYGVADVSLQLMCDATAGRGMAERRGVGRVRHLHTPLLWIQRVVQQQRVRIRKVAGSSNIADMGTKHIEGPLILKFLEAQGFQIRSGRSRMALRAAI